MKVRKKQSFAYIGHEGKPIYSIEFQFPIDGVAVDRNADLLAFTMTQIEVNEWEKLGTIRKGDEIKRNGRH